MLTVKRITCIEHNNRQKWFIEVAAPDGSKWVMRAQRLSPREKTLYDKQELSQ